LASLALFGAFGVWALLEMTVFSKAEGDWWRPETGSLRADGKVALFAVALLALNVFL